MTVEPLKASGNGVTLLKPEPPLGGKSHSKIAIDPYWWPITRRKPALFEVPLGLQSAEPLAQGLGPKNAAISKAAYDSNFGSARLERTTSIVCWYTMAWIVYLWMICFQPCQES
jgi:hypothetical protein